MNSFFPFPDDVFVEEQPLPPNEVIDLLRPMIGEKRLQKIERVIEKRCFGIHPILEGLSDRGNISAVLRSAEGLGNGCVHVVETRRRKLRMANRVSQGAEKWLEILRWHSTTECIEAVKAAKLQLVVTDLNADMSIEDLDLSIPTAIVFGNEQLGATEEMREAADHTVILPMAGFSQSFNISVAAAIALYHLRWAKFGATSTPGDLNELQRERLRAEYFRRSVGGSERILREFEVARRQK